MVSRQLNSHVLPALAGKFPSCFVVETPSAQAFVEISLDWQICRRDRVPDRSQILAGGFDAHTAKSLRTLLGVMQDHGRLHEHRLCNPRISEEKMLRMQSALPC